jgi:cytochrome c-type biogenesis protein
VSEETAEPDAASPASETGGDTSEAQAGSTATIPVSGMTCSGCADNVQTALSQLDGVGRVEVDVEGAVARVESAGAGELDESALRAAVERVGYDTTPPVSEAGERRWKPLVLLGLVVAALALGAVAFSAVNDAYAAPGTLQQLNAVFGEVSLVAFGLALLIGLVVAFAPSSLAMAPAIMGYISTAGAGSTRRAAGLSGLFLVGMLLTNMALGALFALGGQALMRAVSARVWVWYSLIAVVLVAMALVLLGVWRPRLPSFRPRVPQAGGRSRAGGAFALGVPFGLMACPACTPLLMPLALGAAATADPVYGAGLLGAFGLARGVPVVVLGTFTGALQAGGTLARSAGVVQRILGVVLLAAAAWFVVSALAFVGVI